MPLRHHLDALTREFSYTLRGVRRSPGFAAVVIATLAFGIGANAAVVSTVARLMFHAPPGVVDPAGVQRIQQWFLVPMTHERNVRDRFSYSEFLAIQEALPSQVALAGYARVALPMDRDGVVAEVGATYVIGDYFGALGVRPVLGRTFAGDERTLTASTPSAVIGEALWADRFSRRPDVLGDRLRIGAKVFTIVGVVPRSFRGVALDASDVWLPFNTEAPSDSERTRLRTNPWDVRLQLVVRAGPRTTRPVAAAASAALRHVGIMPDASAAAVLAPIGNLLDPQRDHAVATMLSRLLMAAALILAIACTNVVQLFITRAAERRREIAIRFALGMGRGRFMARIAVEGITLAGAAAIGAMVICVWGETALRRRLLPGVSWEGAGGDRAVVATMAIALLAAAFVACVLMVAVRRHDGWSALKAGEGGARRRRTPFRDTLMGAQATLSFVLLLSAGLVIQSLQHVRAEWVGDSAPDVVMASIPVVDGATQHLSASALATAVANDVSQLRRLPGVDAVATTASEPIRSVMGLSIHLPGRDSTPRMPGGLTVTTVVSPEFFHVMGIRVLRGRVFDDQDRAGSAPVAIVSALMARVYWPGQDPIGKCLLVGPRTGPCRSVVGVVEDTHAMKVREPQSLRYYLPTAQILASSLARSFLAPHVILVRCQPGRLGTVLPLMHGILEATHGPRLTWTVEPFASVLEPELRPWRLSALLFTVLGALAVVVAGVGVYGAVAYAARQRMRELAIRRALGASTGRIIAALVVPALRLVGAGAVLGALGGVVLGRFWQSLLYQISPADPASYVQTAAVLCVATLIACAAPMMRVAGLSPATVLAEE